MIQISEDRFTKAINVLKNAPYYTTFKKTVTKKIAEYINRATIIYDSKKNVVLKTEKEVKECKTIFNYTILPNTFFSTYLNYIQNIDELVFSLPSDLETLKGKFENIPNRNNTIVARQFFYDIQKILSYDLFRRKVVPEFYNLLGIKTCVYCNAQHTIFLNKSQLGRYQADHNIPKSSHPFLSITLSNLYPTCNNCNHLKGTSIFKFKLYYKDKINQENFLAYLEETDIVDFVNGNFDDSRLEIRFRAVPDDFNDKIRLGEIYENHKDYAADLIKKKIIYNQAYKDSLTHHFKELFPSTSRDVHNKQLFDRLLYGSSLEEDDIHKRVFSKLNIDIMNQLDRLSPDKLEYK